jgi:predicted SPOUT superfamily RNA methylase MTH1
MSLTYSFLDTHCAIVGPGGAFSLTGGAAAEGITIEPREDKSKLDIGADGSGMYSLRADKSARLTIRLLKNSPVNALLSGLYNFQQISSANWGQNTVSVVSSIGDVITLRQVAFVRQPTVVYAEQGGMNEWQMEAVKMDEILAASIVP